MPKKKRKTKRTAYKFLIALVIYLGVFSFFLLIILIHDLPDLNKLQTKEREASVIFESYDGKLIATYGDLFRKAVSYNELPHYVPEAIIAIEDKRFFEHSGIDIKGLIRAAFKNISSGRVVQGGSTITQQLVKNLFLSPSRSIRRKVQEVILAIWMEKKFSKKQILSIYMNRVYFGAGAYGIDAASYKYFQKSAKKLTLCEAARLAGLLKSPSQFSPFYNYEKSNERLKIILDQMVEKKYISEAEKDEAILESKKEIKITMSENRYFTDWILEKLPNLVSAVDKEDLIVRTTLDSRLQEKATEIIQKTLAEYGFKYRTGQMALIAMDKTGAIRALVGGASYGKSQYNRALALRSFGSAFKFFVFLSALEKNFSIDSKISDLPITIGHWHPKNYGYKPLGNISLRMAFYKSVNTATVRLAREVGFDYIIKRAHDLGIQNSISRTPAVALGGSDVNLLDLTASYGAVMKNGIKMIPFGVISVKNKKGKFLYKACYENHPRVIKPDIVNNMKILLKDVVEKGTARRARLPQEAFGKTGTSNNSRDASFIGFSGPLIVGIWNGNDDNSPMNKHATGGFLPAIVWKNFMLYALGYAKNSKKPQQKKKNLSDFVHNLF